MLSKTRELAAGCDFDAKKGSPGLIFDESPQDSFKLELKDYAVIRKKVGIWKSVETNFKRQAAEFCGVVEWRNGSTNRDWELPRRISKHFSEPPSRQDSGAAPASSAMLVIIKSRTSTPRDVVSSAKVYSANATEV